MKPLFITMAFALLPVIALAAGFGGVGIDGMPWADGRIVIKQLVSGGPAEVAGMKVGDIITHIDGKQTEGSNFKEMVERRLRGKEGTPVLIRVRRPGLKKPLDFNLVRRQLVVAPKKRPASPQAERFSSSSSQRP